MRKVLFHMILLLVGACYAIAFFEINIGNTHQTWNDPDDSYIAAPHSSEISLAPQKIDCPQSVLFSLPPVFCVSAGGPQAYLNGGTPHNPHSFAGPVRLFMRHCAWLI